MARARVSGTPLLCELDSDTADSPYAGVQQELWERTTRDLVEAHPLDADEIVDRLIFSLINEGFKILEEGIAQRPSDIDVVYVYGYGFPAWRGGPMYYADAVGLDHMLERIIEFRDRFGKENWTPAPLLEKLVSTNTTIAEWAASK